MSVVLDKSDSGAHLSVVESSERRVANVIVDTLRELGIDTFYGVPGGAISPIYDALIDAPDMKLINTRHETGALYMAAGHALTCGNMACVLMTSGPGVTNAITGLTSAFADSVPLIAIGGEVPHRNFGRGALQEGSKYEMDTISMVRSVTKYQAAILNPRSASNVVRRAVATARSGRQGPVFLSLPLDVAADRVAPTIMSSRVSTGFQLDDELVARASKALQGAKNGMILMGSGARHPMAVTQVRILAETLQIPVATTPKGKGLFPERSPLSLGVFGYGGHLSALKHLNGHPDVLLAVGCGLGETSTNSWTPVLQPTSMFIQIDIDSSQIGKNYHVDIGLVGSAHLVLTGLVSKVRCRPPAPARGIEYFEPDTRFKNTVPLQPPRVIQRIQEVMPSDTIYASDIGEHLLFVLHYLQVDHSDGFLGHLGLGAMGSGIGGAIGAKVAFADRPVVAICGDYGFQMYGMELATCVENGIGVIFAIFNDSRMRMVENGLNVIFGRTIIGDGPTIDFAGLARAVGAHGITVRTSADFDDLTPELIASNVPVVLDIYIDPESSFRANARFDTIGGFASDSEKE